MADKRISQLIERTDIANNDVLPIVASGATTTNKVTISTIQNWMQDNLDVGVTSVGITLGSSGTDVNVTGSPITTSGNITINIPTASATNRGLLSAADWSTFNGKQNSITLTTSGTSGAATLVGSTLNIPNYSTGVANAYVPYVGAIGSVTLGYNSLSASQINIDGASPTGGSYLGFKHSTSVNTGTDGYTSMYTFGTNTIAFKSVSGGNSKDFSFSMVGITPNVAGGRQYTLPDASGTLALTSDLSGYVTLGTAQTITGSKTFNSRIIGQDATLTGSGSADTLEVAHTSGSGIAVDISKAGDGEGLRVAKTSGSGNAVTITGGLLSAEAGTFTGDLTSNGELRVSNNAGLTFLQLVNSSAGGRNFTLISSGASNPHGIAAGNFYLRNSTTGTNPLLIDGSTGAATFSSSVTAGGGTEIPNGQFYRARRSSGSLLTDMIGIPSGTDDVRLLTTGDYNIVNGSLTNLMTIKNGGNVGIGTTSPANILSVFQNNASSAATLELTNTSTGANITKSSRVLFVLSDTVGTLKESAYIESLPTNDANVVNADLRFGTRGSDAFPTERMRITSTGNVGIGVTPSAWSGIVRGFQVGQGASFSANTATTDAYMTSNCYYDGSTWRYIKSGEFALSYDVRGGTGDYVWQTAPSGTAGSAFTLTERARITSGGLLMVGTTTTLGGGGSESVNGINIGPSGVIINNSFDDYNAYFAKRSGYTSNGLIAFYVTGSLRGSITTNGTSTSYNTTSDYRLKENVKPVEGALSKIAELKPCTYNFIEDESKEEVIGFIAHEVQEVIPQAVNGQKDAVEIKKVEVSPAELDEEGNVITEAVIEEKEVPVYQGIDHSKLVPLLVAAIQEQQEQIKSLTEQVEALKSQING